MVYTIQRQNESYGPYTLEQVRAMTQAGQIFPNDLAWPQGASGSMTVAVLLQTTQSDRTGGLIPYKNGPALASYYLAVASFIPCIGVITGIVAFFLGLKGLKKVKAEPWVRGTAHAWIGIIVGGGLGLVQLLAFIFVAVNSFLGYQSSREMRREWESRRPGSTSAIQQHLDRGLHPAKHVVDSLAA